MDNNKFQELVLQQFNKVFEKLALLDNTQKETCNELTKLDNAQRETNNKLVKLDNAQREISNKLTKLENAQRETSNKLVELDNAQREISNKLTKLETRLENEVIDKIRGLYDFREVQTSVNDRILAALERIEAKIETHDIQIHILDKTKASKRRAK